MKITKSNLCEYISDFEKSVSDLSEKSFSLSEWKDICKLFSQYDELTSFLVSSDETPANIKEYLINGSKTEFPEEYSYLELYEKFKKKSADNLIDLINKNLKEQDIKSVLNYITYLVQTDINRVEIFEKTADYFIENELTQELIEVYKILFFYSSNPLYFEKIGDVYSSAGDYEKAVSSYIDCAEVSDNNVGVYKKLAEIFKKTGDEVSYNACMEQMKIVEGMING